MDTSVRFIDISEALSAHGMDDLGRKLMTSAYRTFKLSPVALSAGVTAHQNSGLFTSELDGREVFVKAFNGLSDMQNALTATRLAAEHFPRVYGIGAVDDSRARGGGAPPKEDQVLALLEGDDMDGLVRIVGASFGPIISMRWDEFREDPAGVARTLTVALERQAAGNDTPLERFLFDESDDESVQSYGDDTEESDDSGDELVGSDDETSDEPDYSRFWMDGRTFRKFYLFVEPVNCDFVESKVGVEEARALTRALYESGISITDHKRDNFCYAPDGRAVYVDFGGLKDTREGGQLEGIMEVDGRFVPVRGNMEGGGSYGHMVLLAALTVIMSFL